MDKDDDESLREDTYLLKRNYSLRNYQLKLIEIAIKQNTIIFLPTGAGKTLIAVHVLHSKTKQIKGSYLNGSKRAFFVANTKIMVFQIAEVISAHTKFNVGYYTGDMHLDSWSKELWVQQFEENHVLVMTAEILRQILQLNYLSVSDISLLVFDECHHAVSDHPYRMIMVTITEANCPEPPLILGLSAILLNSNPKRGTVKNLIQSLETTFNAKVFTETELQDVLKTSARPEEKLVIYEPYKLPSFIDKVLKIYNQSIIALDNICLKPVDSPAIPEGGRDYKERNSARRIRKVFVLASECLQHLGPFCGSMAALYYAICVEKRRLLENDPKMVQVLIYARTQLNKVRKLLINEMGEEESFQMIYRYSSPKVQRLLNLIMECYKDAKENHVSTILFVVRKVKAIVLSFMLKRLSVVSKEFEQVKAEFVIGSSIYKNDFTFLECGNEDIVKQFSSRELNLLVATNVLEEGIDVTGCNVVISFDFPLAYPSYIQSRGRARDKNSTYFLFSEASNIKESREALDTYKSLHEELHEVVQKNLEDDSSDPSSLKDTKEKFYYSPRQKEAFVDGSLAIKVVIRYCSRLPQDRFCTLGPTCWYEDVGTKKKAYIQLPTSSPLRELINGDPKPNSKLAKESVFLKTVKMLKSIGELDDELNPKSYETTKKSFDYLFPHFRRDDADPRLPMPGTKKRVRNYDVIFPSWLCNCLPKAGEVSYLHIFDLKLSDERPICFRERAMYDLLNHTCTYAVLSSKPIPKICEFPLFKDDYLIICNFLVNYEELILTENDIEDIKSFHYALFRKVLYLARFAHAFDNRNKERSYFIVPVDKTENGRYFIDWEVIRSDFCKRNVRAVVRYNPSFEIETRKGYRSMDDEDDDGPSYFRNPYDSDMQSMSLMRYSENPNRLLRSLNQTERKRRPDFQPTEAEYKYFIISPSYRYQDPPLFYAVVKICHELTPMSQFPKSEFDDFYSYYKQKYDITITNVNQPLLHVTPLISVSNYNKPRFEKLKKKSKERYFEEHFVPELCHVYFFLSKYWVKANLLPSLLSRLSNLLIAEEFRRQLTRDMKLDCLDLPDNKQWRPLHSWCNLSALSMEITDEDESRPDSTVHSRFPLSKLKLHSCPKSHELIADPERHLYDTGMCDLEFYVKCVKNHEEQETGCKLFKMNKETERMISENYRIAVPKLKMLDWRAKEPKVELGRLVQALTAKSAIDFVDCERLEILGDCFLKFSVSLYLFNTFDHNEGFLTSLKQKVVGNRNLLYCGWSRNLEDVVNTLEFEPRSDWSPPLFYIPKRIRDAIVNQNVDPAVLYRLVFPPDEEFAGELSEETYVAYENMLANYDKACDDNATRQMLGMRMVKDKAVSDCLEALIGLFVEDLGIPIALELIKYFDILPKKGCSYQELIAKPHAFLRLVPNCDEMVSNMLHEFFYSELERTLGYTFKDKAILLEALTHPSYSRNRYTHCYQRLEFLGDAILDFILTCYIYQNYSDMSPGQITDLRSALVNNITFACLVVRYELYKYMLSFSSPLNAAIESFVAFQSERNHVVDENVMILLEEKDCLMSEAVQVPKPLGDLFESLAAAIFLDSGNSLDAVWNVYYKLMRKELEEFPKKVPKSSARLLSEICRDHPFYEISVLNKKVKASCTVYYNGNEIHTHGFGVNGKEAKKSAAKHALKKIMEMSK